MKPALFCLLKLSSIFPGFFFIRDGGCVDVMLLVGFFSGNGSKFSAMALRLDDFLELFSVHGLLLKKQL